MKHLLILKRSFDSNIAIHVRNNIFGTYLAATWFVGMYQKDKRARTILPYPMRLGTNINIFSAMINLMSSDSYFRNENSIMTQFRIKDC